MTEKLLPSLICSACLLLSGCSGDSPKKTEAKHPGFMFWCFRQEKVASDYRIPDMNSEKVAAYLQGRVRSVPGYIGSSYDIETRTMRIEYSSSTIRSMNFEEAIALAGFSVNNRPANPKAKIPEGLK